MANYLIKYAPRLSDIADSLRELTKKNVPFIWGPAYTEAFGAIMKETTSIPILKQYDPK